MLSFAVNITFKCDVLFLGRTKNKIKSGLQKITCTCGAEILLIPDVQVMNEAIEKHLEEHRSKVVLLGNLESLQQIRDYLISQIFEKASELG